MDVMPRKEMSTHPHKRMTTKSTKPNRLKEASHKLFWPSCTSMKYTSSLQSEGEYQVLVYLFLYIFRWEHPEDHEDPEGQEEEQEEGQDEHQEDDQVNVEEECQKDQVEAEEIKRRM